MYLLHNTLYSLSAAENNLELLAPRLLIHYWYSDIHLIIVKINEYNDPRGVARVVRLSRVRILMGVFPYEWGLSSSRARQVHLIYSVHVVWGLLHVPRGAGVVTPACRVRKASRYLDYQKNNGSVIAEV